MDRILQRIAEVIKEFLIGSIEVNLNTMFSDVNTKVAGIATEVSKTPMNWNGSIFSLVQTLSTNVILPIAGIIITYVLCYELITMIMEKNHGTDFEFWEFFVYFFKMYVAVWVLSHTFEIVMAVFDVGHHIVTRAGGSISHQTNIDAASVISSMRSSMITMEIPDLLLLMIETFIISLGMKILSVLITVILYGRMIEIYLYVSVAPVPFATMTNREWGSIGSNYLKGLIALAFQGFFIMVCVAIYAVLVSSITVAANLHTALWGVAGYTIILCFSLFKTGSLSKSIFNAH